MAKGVSLRLHFNRQSGICVYCHHPMTLEKHQMNTATRDHIIPRAAEGPTVPFNIVISCYRCNQIKGSMSLSDFFSTYHPYQFPPAYGPISGSNAWKISNIKYTA